MQTAETFTIKSFFKLLLLFALLITGVMLKNPAIAPTIVDARNLKASPPSAAPETDSSQQAQQLYFRFFIPESSSAAL